MIKQTENAIQNILPERFDGVFIATGNLADNPDIAFEHRTIPGRYCLREESDLFQEKLQKSKNRQELN